MSFSYRDVQQIWNSKSDGEACARCRDRRSRCDGRFPCGRCAKARLECVYSGWIDEEDEQRTEKMVREVEALEEAFERLGGEMMRIRAESEKVAAASMGPIPESKGGEEEEKEEKVSRVVSGRREYARSEQWIVTLGKRGVRVQTDIRMMRQLHEFLKNLAPGVCRGPAMGYRSVGTSAMLVRFTSQWRRWHDTQVYQFPNDPLLLRRAVTVPFGITPKFKDLLLERIVVQSFECRPWGRMTTSEQFFDRLRKAKSSSSSSSSSSPPPLHHTALLHAIGAIQAEHMILHHVDPVTLHLPPDFNPRDLSHDLSTRYAARARDLLLEIILDDKPPHHNVVVALQALSVHYITLGDYTQASFCVSMALRVAAQLGYHLAARDEIDGPIDPAELEDAATWNILACTDRAFSSLAGLPVHTTEADTHLNLRARALREPFPPDITESKLQRLHCLLHLTKHTAIYRDYLDAWYGDSPSSSSVGPTQSALDRFVVAFAQWESELPPILQLSPSPRTGAFLTRSSFLAVFSIHLIHHISQIDLYRPFLPDVHAHPAVLAAGRAERACSDHAVAATRIVLSSVRAGGCTFPISEYPIAVNMHMWLAKGARDLVTRRTNRACVARALGLLRGAKECRVGERRFIGYARFVEEFMVEDGIPADADALLDPEDYYKPVKAMGTGW